MAEMDRQILEELQKVNKHLATIAKGLQDLPAFMPSEPDLSTVEGLLEKIERNTAAGE